MDMRVSAEIVTIVFLRSIIPFPPREFRVLHLLDMPLNL